MGTDPDIERRSDSDCPLPSGTQTRNLLIFAANYALIYLGAPVLYVGIAHASLLEKLGQDNTVANLPLSLYFWMTLGPILVAWYFPAARMLKPLLLGTLTVVALSSATVVAALLVPLPSQEEFVVAAVLCHGAVMGCTLGVAANCNWEVLGRAVSSSRRGQALGLAFGVGPVFALAASLASQVALERFEYPWNFALLFAFGVPTMLLAAVVSGFYVIPLPDVENSRLPFLSGIFGGVTDFLRDPLIRRAALATFLIASGYQVMNNFTLYTKEAVGELSEKYAGYQMAIRFGSKIFAGLLLGWLLTRLHPKSGLLFTGLCTAAAVAWVLYVPGLWFLVGFGLMGAGELWGVYYPNYILTASPKSKVRRNSAIISLIYMPTGFAAFFFGRIGDLYSLRESFVVAFVVLAGTMVYVQLVLPNRPTPPPHES